MRTFHATLDCCGVFVSFGFVERQIYFIKKEISYHENSSESDSQSEQSIEGQLRICQEYAQRQSILILNTYIDRAMTGTNDNRPDFQRMIKDSAKCEWNFVLVYKLDRFLRNKYEMAMHKKNLKDNGVKVISATEFIPDTPEGIIFESMLEGYAEYYSAELSQKILRGNNESRRKGNLTGGKIPYGYKNVDKKAVIVEEEAKIVRYIYEQYAIGIFVKDIIATLTAKGLLHHGKPFIGNTIYNILKNERYSGIYKHKNEQFDNIYPQIVSQEIFEKVRAKVNANTYGKRSVKMDYLLRHKLKCGYCGKSVNGEHGTSHNGEKKYYYKCWNRKKGNPCKKSNIRKDLLEEMILDSIVRKLSNPKELGNLVNGLLETQERLLRESSALSALLREKRQTESTVENIMSAIEKGVVTNTTTKRLKDLESKLEDLEKNILIEKSKTAIKLSEKDIREFYEQALSLEPKLLINTLIKEIILYNERIEIHYNSPLITSPDESRDFSYCSETLHYVTQEMQITMTV